MAKQSGGYAQFGPGVPGAASPTQQPYAAQPYGYGADPYLDQRQTGVSRPLTIDDVVIKTGITLAVLSTVAVISYYLVSANLALAGPFSLIGALGGLGLVLVATFARQQNNPAIVLSYAALEGLVLGAISFVLANFTIGGQLNANPGALIGQAILGTIGVFAGMLVVYKTGAIRVTPKLTRMVVAGVIGVLVLSLGNLVLGMFGVGGGAGLGLRSGGPIAIIFSLACIGLAAFFFLIDFDRADQMVRAGVPAKAAWGIALGLTVTLVWLYLEILRLLSYFNGGR